MNLSICVTVKNRSRADVDGEELLLFPKCVQSIVDAVEPGISCELVVADWHSDDWPLNEWIHEYAHPIPVNILQLEGGFSRGLGLNIAANAAKSDFLLFADTDLLLGSEVIDSGLTLLRENKAYFPILYYFNDTTHTDGWWNHYSYGNCFVTKKMFNEAGQWPEYKTWGKEDDHFYENVGKVAEVFREQSGGFFHQWHPDDLIWKNRYAEKADEIAYEINEVKQAKNDLIKLLLPGETIILVDEARFGGSDCIPGHLALPLTELNGEYGGAPADDAVAIQEFERLISKGASYIVFAWMAFWWLDHYKQFHEYLKQKYKCILESERLIIFDLKEGGHSK